MLEAFEAGKKIPESGVYKVLHAKQHVPPHHVTALYGDIFPACHKCLGRVRFELAISAPHIKAHPLFMNGGSRPE
jgi:hypothetical protein